MNKLAYRLIFFTPSIISSRSTYILKRIDEDQYFHQQPMEKEPLGFKKRVYEELGHDTLNKTGKIKVILTTTVEELGIRGDVIEVWQEKAHMDLLPSGLAVYASPENREHFLKDIQDKKEATQSHSAFAAGVIRKLKEINLRLLMNADHSWTLDKNHILIALRHSGIVAPVEAITLPTIGENNEPISKENAFQKSFYIPININNMETIHVKAYLDLFSKNPMKMKEILKLKETLAEDKLR